VLPHGLCRHICIAGLGEIAVGSPANEATFTLWIEPAERLAVGNDRREWRARTLLDTWSTTLLTTALSAATALIATASSVVTVIALAVLSTAAAFALLLAAAGLRIVAGLLL
jgi:hypothetical protein